MSPHKKVAISRLKSSSGPSMPLDSPDLYLNRELEWLRFNERVLLEAESSAVPLMERFKFLIIFDSNLDEFFMVRLSGLLRLLEHTEHGERASYPDVADLEGMFDDVWATVKNLKHRFEICLAEDIFPGLTANGIVLAKIDELSQDSLGFIDDYFERQVFPVLTPYAVDSAHPFPFLSNLSIYIAVVFEEISETGEPLLAFLEVPKGLERFVSLSGKDGRIFVLLEDLMKRHVGRLFPWKKIVGSYLFRVTRNLDYQLLEAEVKDLMESLEFELKNRAQKIAVRLEVEQAMPEAICARLRTALDLDSSDVYAIQSILGLRDAWVLYRLAVAPFLRDSPFFPVPHPRSNALHDIFALIRDGDILLHHPYDSFHLTLEFLRAAARDSNVLALKQTLYRTGGDSPVTEILIEAAENGKEVVAVVELKARFDEHTNIAWARRLERAGVHVVYGSVGLKTHAKCALVIRREGGELRRYAHFSTGNYNSTTAKQYTDLALLTADEALTADAMKLFNLLTGFNIVQKSASSAVQFYPSFQKLRVAPFDLRSALLDLIREECQLQRQTGKGHIIFKVNALLDPLLIRALYEASCCGVRVDLIVRGMCALRPGIPGVSENIEVVAVIDRFLEHSRLFLFERSGKPQVYLSSADLMVRNLNKRIEVMWPVETPALQAQLRTILQMYLQDNVKSHRKLPDGTYRQNTPGKSKSFRAQELLKV